MNTLVRNFPLPPTTNHLRTPIRMGGSARLITSEDARIYKDRVRELMVLEPAPPEWDRSVPMCAYIMIWYPTLAGDAENRSKAILDSLQGHVYHDDKQLQRVTAQKGKDADNPHIDVRIERWDYRLAQDALTARLLSDFLSRP